MLKYFPAIFIYVFLCSENEILRDGNNVLEAARDKLKSRISELEDDARKVREEIELERVKNSAKTHDEEVLDKMLLSFWGFYVDFSAIIVLRHLPCLWAGGQSAKRGFRCSGTSHCHNSLLA